MNNNGEKNKLLKDKEFLSIFLRTLRDKYEMKELQEETGKSFEEVDFTLKYYDLEKGMHEDKTIVGIKRGNLHDAINKIDKRLEILESLELQKKTAEANKKLVIVTVGLVIVTGFLVWSNFLSIQNQNSLSPPNLKLTKLNEIHSVQGYHMIQEQGYGAYISLCFRNDGRSPTGYINFMYGEDADIKHGSDTIENIFPGDGDCVQIGLVSFTCIYEPEKCQEARKNPPVGKRKINIEANCQFCDEDLVIPIELCLEPTEEC